MIIRRYIITEITKPAVNILILLLAIFASYTAITQLTAAGKSQLPPGFVGTIIGLRISLALEMLLPVTLYFSVIIALGRLHKDSEITALAACGLGTGAIVRPVVLLAIPVSLISAGASLFIRSEAYSQIYALRSEAAAEFKIARLEAKRFIEFVDGRYTFFCEEIDRSSGIARKVFIRERNADERKVIQAEEMLDGGHNRMGYPVFILRRGHLVDFSLTGEKNTFTHFEKAFYPLAVDTSASRRYRRKAASTLHLLQSDRLEDEAELQWRLSTPLSTILLALLGIPLSRTNPRKGKYAKTGVALVIFAVYYQLFAIAKTQVENGTVNPAIGIWWVPALLITLILFMFWRNSKAWG